MAGDGIGYYSRRQRQGRSSGRFPAVRSRPPDADIAATVGISRAIVGVPRLVSRATKTSAADTDTSHPADHRVAGTITTSPLITSGIPS
jgi:hypothetical protein